MKNAGFSFVLEDVRAIICGHGPFSLNSVEVPIYRTWATDLMGRGYLQSIPNHSFYGDVLPITKLLMQDIPLLK